MAASRWWLSHEWYPRILFALLVAFSIVLGIAPHDRSDWLLENALLFAGVAVLVATHRSLPLSRVSYTLIFVFMCLHAVGARYRTRSCRTMRGSSGSPVTPSRA